MRRLPRFEQNHGIRATRLGDYPFKTCPRSNSSTLLLATCCEGIIAFKNRIAEIRPALAKLVEKAGQQSAPLTGATQGLRDLRAELETLLHVLARAGFEACDQLGRAEDAGKLDLTPSDLHNSRAVALAATAETVLDLVEPLTVAPLGGAGTVPEGSGVTAARVAAVDDLWDRYRAAVGAPAGARARRKALSEELPEDVRALEAIFARADNLVIQFGTTAAGRSFVDAWFNARRVVDLGRRAAKPKSAPATPPPAGPH